MKRGFTLSETALSLALIGLLLIFLLNLFPSAILAQRQNEQRRRATGLSRTFLEQQMDRDFSALPSGLVYQFEPVDSLGTRYSSILRVSARPGTSDKFLRILQVEVTWQNRGRKLSVSRELWRYRLAHQK